MIIVGKYLVSYVVVFKRSDFSHLKSGAFPERIPVSGAVSRNLEIRSDFGRRRLCGSTTGFFEPIGRTFRKPKTKKPPFRSAVRR